MPGLVDPQMDVDMSVQAAVDSAHFAKLPRNQLYAHLALTTATTPGPVATFTLGSRAQMEAAVGFIWTLP